MSAPRSIRRGQALAGWMFVSPTLVVLGLFLAVPVLMALWVSFTDWNGRGSPFAPASGSSAPTTTASWSVSRAG